MKKVYTIECGYLLDNGYYYCEHELCFLSERKYKKQLKALLLSTANNFSKNGYYIDCYCDEENLDKDDIQYIKDFSTTKDCPKKATLLQSYLIKNL